MKQEEFDKIIKALDFRLDSCSHYLDDITDTESLKAVSFGKLIDIRKFCQTEVDEMTKILMVDLYHIIGMGDLTPIQMMKFIYKIKKYSSYRPNIKVIATHLTSFESIPDLPVRTKFKLLQLCDLTLTSGEIGPEIVEEQEDISEYEKARDKSNNKESSDCAEVRDESDNKESVKESLYDVISNGFMVKEKNLEKFFAFWKDLTKSQQTYKSLTRILADPNNKNKVLEGWNWLCIDNTYFVVFQSDMARKCFEKFCKENKNK